MYAIVRDLFSQAYCVRLARHMRSLKKGGNLVQDEQCPLSWSVHGDNMIDEALVKAQTRLEAILNTKLIPTYSYCRMYQKGEVLKRHRDRPACEYSVSLTLAYDEKHPWSIWFDGQELTDVEVGCGVVYNGCEHEHWREPYQGDEQIQLFLHYVDADGPYKDEKFDRRPELGVPKATAPLVNEVYYWYFKGALDLNYCDSLVEALDKDYDKFIDGLIGGGVGGALATDVRDVKKMPLNPYSGISPHLIGLGFLANKQAWKFDVNECNQVDYLRYAADGHYLQHMDTFMTYPSQMQRKLSVLAFLDDGFEGGKLFLSAGHDKMYPIQEKGTVIIFPSFLVHGVEPVTEGIRHSVICWLEGPPFR